MLVSVITSLQSANKICPNLAFTDFISTLPAKSDVCMTVHHLYNNINNQLDATITVY